MISQIYAFSRKGCQLAGQLHAWLKSAGYENTCHTVERLAEDDLFQPMKTSLTLDVGDSFDTSQLIVFIGAAGIAVRAIAPYVSSKESDPAVIVIDDCGTFVISLLSGHLGKANLLAERISQVIGATPVITTATDRNNRFSPDGWASAWQLKIADMQTLKAVSSAILEKNIPITADYPLPTPLPAGLYQGNQGTLGIYITYRQASPFQQTLRIIPPVLYLGLGCRRGTTAAALADFIAITLDEQGLHPLALAAIATIDLKADEPGLCTYCHTHRIPLTFYSAGELEEMKGDFTPSPFVKSITGTDNICERAALKAAGKGQLIMKKTAAQGITLALAVKDWRISFHDEK